MTNSNSSSGAAMAPEPARERGQEQAIPRDEGQQWDDTPDAIVDCKGNSRQSERWRGLAPTTSAHEAGHGATTHPATH